jgi:predicted transcriptional regulator
MDNSLVVKGIIYLALTPALLFAVIVFSLVFSLLSIGNLLIIVTETLAIYFILLARKTPYTDSEIMDKVQIPNAPAEIDELLKKKTRTNRLINANLILVLGRKRKLSQSDLVEQMKKIGIEYSQPAIEEYLSDLEVAGILESKKAYKKEYHLTPKGEWCYQAIKKCFPTRFMFFVIRHYLGKRKLPAYPQ